MFFNTCLFAWKALLTPTIEKMIFLSSTVAILCDFNIVPFHLGSRNSLRLPHID